MSRQARSFCRICNAHCGMILTIDEDETIVSIRGDKDQLLSRGYACFKGLQAEEAHHGAARLLRPLKRQPDGGFVELPLEQALDEIAAKTGEIMARDGSEAIALYTGSGGSMNSTATPMANAFMAALGSSSLYSSLTIDQSCKVVAFERLGAWAAGHQDMSQSDVLMLFATNPLLSHAATPVIGPDPTRRLKAAKARGLKLIVVDPRRTETAYQADLFVQPLPGEDSAILAGILRMVLVEGWHDDAFCAAHVGEEGMRRLRGAVAPFTPERVEARAGLEPGSVAAIATLFARDNKRGAAYAFTGTSMSPFSNLTQHLVEVLNVVCGRFRRAGEKPVIDPMGPVMDVLAEVIPPPRSWAAVPTSRIRGVGRLGGEKLTATLPDEILTPGPGRVRALFVNGGNPVVAFPGQTRAVEAMRDLELLVAIEPYMTATAELAHYVLPPRMQYERADLPLVLPGYSLQPESWAQYTPEVLGTPPGSDLADDWYVYWAIAHRLGRTIRFYGEALDERPTTDHLLDLRLRGARISLRELRQEPAGVLMDKPEWRVKPGRNSSQGCFDVMPDDVKGELEAYLQRELTRSAGGFQLISRRTRDLFNSNGLLLDAVRKRNAANPVHVHPDDLADLGIAPGELVEISSERGRIRALCAADDTMRRGVVSMTHAWGGVPGSARQDGHNVNLLIEADKGCEAINAMPWMSSLPVGLTKVVPATA